MDVRRFGVGHRRPDGPPGTKGVTAQVIHSDARGHIAELAFARHAAIEPHSNPNTTFFIVIEGGGFVQVGNERARVAAGEAVVWPAGVLHGASTDVSEMRAIVVELAGPDDAAVRGIIEGAVRAIGPGERAASSAAGTARAEGSPATEEGDGSAGGREDENAGRGSRAEGELAPRPPRPLAHDESQGEPF